MTTPAPLRLLLIALLLTAGAACSSSPQTASADSPAQPKPRIIDPADSAAYYLGRGEGLQLLDCSTQEEICDRMLDLRARQHIIKTQIRPSAADAYIYGIEDAVAESGDTLANIIINTHNATN